MRSTPLTVHAAGAFWKVHIEHNFFVCNVINFICIEGSQPLTFQVTTALQHSMQQMTTPPRGLNEIELIDANDNRISVWMAAPNLNMINFAVPGVNVRKGTWALYNHPNYQTRCITAYGWPHLHPHNAQALYTR